MIRTLTIFAAATVLTMAANVRFAAAMGTDLLYCRGPLAHTLTIDGVLRIASKAFTQGAGAGGVNLPPGTCAYQSKPTKGSAKLELKFHDPNVPGMPHADLTRQMGMWVAVVTVLTQHLGQPTAVVSFPVEYDSSGVPRVKRNYNAVLNYEIGVSFSAPAGPKFDPSNFNFESIAPLEPAK